MIRNIFFGLLAIVVIAAAGLGAMIWREAQGVDPATLEAQYMTPADRYINVGGARVRVREEGPANAPVMILLHGFIYSLETWDAWAASFSEDYRVIRFDLAGHGLTGPDPQERYAPEERAAFIGDVMDAIDVERAIVAGNSLGGLAAWRFAAAAPDRVSALILLAPGAYPTNGVSDTPAEVPAAMKLFLRTAPEAGAVATLESVFADDAYATPERAQRLRDLMRRRGNGEALVKSIEEFTLPDPSADLARITAPTLILWGAEDAVLPASDGERLAAAIPNARLIVYDGVGHVPQEEAAARSAADARAFLDSLVAPASAGGAE
ncbi:MAG: alpha/beta hydrolase [Pseudomonadota bacterium]